MRTTTVPAQITTVEDKIAGEISLTQLLLLVTPIFGGAAIFVVLPPFFSSAPYKIVIIVCIAAVFATLAIRIKGRIVLAWLLVLARYNTRARYFIFNKNDTYLREILKQDAPQVSVEKLAMKKVARKPLPSLRTEELIRIEEVLANPKANLHFKTNKKGGLSVHVTEIS